MWGRVLLSWEGRFSMDEAGVGGLGATVGARWATGHVWRHCTLLTGAAAMCSRRRRNNKDTKLIYLDCPTVLLSITVLVLLALCCKWCYSILEGVQYRASCVCTLASVLALYCKCCWCSVQRPDVCVH